MNFTASDGEIVIEERIENMLSITIKQLNRHNSAYIAPWAVEFLEWYLDKKIETNNTYFKLHEDITQDELKQLEQLKAYLEL